MNSTSNKYILLSVVCLMALLWGCGRGTAEVQDPVPGRPVRFATGIDTRGQLISQLNGCNFGVIGYILDNDWQSANFSARPDAFWYRKAVACSSEGSCSYTTTQQWLDDKYYSFFAYYPYNDPAVTLSGATVESTPYLTYTLPTGDASNLCDLMAASAKDCTSVNTGQVVFWFSHLLFCIDLAAQNLNDYAVTLSNIVFRFDNLYSTYRINLDKSSPTPGGSLTNTAFTIANNITVQPTINTGSVNITPDGRSLMLIPQTGLSGTLSFNFTSNGTTTTHNIDFAHPAQQYKAGYRYTFNLLFIGESITVQVAINEWTDKQNNIEFD